jgi:hypothetical protein
MRYCIVTVCLLWLVAGSAVAGPGLLVAPYDTTVVAGTTFQIQILVDSSIDSLMGYDVTVAFDSTIVELVSVDEGSLPGSGGAPTFFHWFGAGALSDSVHVNGAVLGTTVDGPGLLFTITFKGLREGATPVSFVRTELRDGFNAVISHGTTDGIVNVAEPIPVRSVTWGAIKNLYR